MADDTSPHPTLMALIAHGFATELFNRDQILQRYGLDEAGLQAIEANPYYQRVLQDYTKEWHAPSTTAKRLAFYAQVALEEQLPILAARMGDRQSALSDAVNTAKLFRDLAGIAPPVAGSGVSQGTPFTISINFGDRKVALETKTVPPLEEDKLLELPSVPTKNSDI